jgi:hypothetical protein
VEPQVLEDRVARQVRTARRSIRPLLPSFGPKTGEPVQQAAPAVKVALEEKSD